MLLNSWYINGTHYAHTLEDWLKLQDQHKKDGLLELENDAEAKGVGKQEGTKAFYRSAALMLDRRNQIDTLLACA